TRIRIPLEPPSTIRFSSRLRDVCQGASFEASPAMPLVSCGLVALSSAWVAPPDHSRDEDPIPEGRADRQRQFCGHPRLQDVSKRPGLECGTLQICIVVHGEHHDLRSLLERDGVMERVPHTDGRIKAMRPTAKGRRVLEVAWPLWAKAQDTVLR